MRGIAAVAVAILAAAAPAGAEEKPAFSHFYRAAEGWVGDAIVHDIRRPATPACLLEDDLDTLQFALEDGKIERVQAMLAGDCVMLPNGSYGTILGATPSGGGYFFMRMDYVQDIRDLDGIEIFVPVASLRDIGKPTQAFWDQYHALLKR